MHTKFSHISALLEVLICPDPNLLTGYIMTVRLSTNILSGRDGATNVNEEIGLVTFTNIMP